MLKPIPSTFTFLAYRRAVERAERRKKVHELVFLVLAVVIVAIMALFALAGCGSSLKASDFPETTRAAAAASLEFAECLQQGGSTIATPQSFTKDAVIAVAETCGLRAIPSGLAILVAFYRDMKAKIAANQNATIILASPKEAPQ